VSVLLVLGFCCGTLLFWFVFFQGIFGCMHFWMIDLIEFLIGSCLGVGCVCGFCGFFIGCRC